MTTPARAYGQLMGQIQLGMEHFAREMMAGFRETIDGSRRQLETAATRLAHAQAVAREDAKRRARMAEFEASNPDQRYAVLASNLEACRRDLASRWPINTREATDAR